MTFISTFILFLTLTAIDAQINCSHGNCINIRNCPEIISILRGPRPFPPEKIRFLRKLQCGFEGNDPKVCCNQTMTITTKQLESDLSVSQQTTTIMTEESGIDLGPPNVTNHPNLRLLNHSRCGLTSMGLKMFGGEKTRVLEFPWMALLAYDDVENPNLEFRCGGTIISSRYILTAAHCVTSLQTGLTLASVRVGEHDISKERDCEKDSEGREIFCAEKYQDFGIENVTFHPNYTKEHKQNDIALIRLNGTLNFTRLNVKPICLPFKLPTVVPERIILTGWGTTENGTRSSDLLRASLPLIRNELCKDIYKKVSIVSYKQLCAGGEAGTDSCKGDSGGPLQAFSRYNIKSLRVVQHGVVSYGVKNCSLGVPGVYTRVAYYMDWILDSMTD
ncbi:phenoloxidase-activating factor 3-like isoform X2 [Cardiocondyla obscurior]|uniref:phenoloxidase-activating factor 3-like isoform X2 n=1 Tax=Cardiocondyla obscurior TaxID=286306 RepID=UPI00396560D1